jgi:hypothetical protein
VSPPPPSAVVLPAAPLPAAAAWHLVARDPMRLRLALPSCVWFVPDAALHVANVVAADGACRRRKRR